jgi:hypothetical protein
MRGTGLAAGGLQVKRDRRRGVEHARQAILATAPGAADLSEGVKGSPNKFVVLTLVCIDRVDQPNSGIKLGEMSRKDGRLVEFALG